ncbi:MAG TPA: Gfo/Idh/MocA family oxidoreductase [Sedimentisphaerales bacterium]|nr:Gfo/Idh/MocA family oxidoreductase [Phycisphaerae bacterium]HON92870.1 Gfo/Idh/MocA family oxidoreductase [Sedimentisphaerales bacterium]HQG47882.1 Gfo/Idh/MocA family oxidoreductase [Sedimentisphaerales bacterium]HQI28275.1 Gfo/Idh/MocA family oxidoreductase [Sedimentisphaerales bacterium]
MKLDRKLRMGLIGGGPGAFIGEVHRKASRLDGEIELVAGAFDIDPKKSQDMGKHLALDPKRVYNTYQDMIQAESALPADKRIDFVAVTTPNNWHFPIARDFLKAGFHVMCEKPMTLTSDEAKELQKLVREKKLVFGLMHNYTGYPMAKLARDMVKKGDLGKIRKIVVQYPQGWLATALEKTGQLQASWRTDPKQTGIGGCVGDIGTHAANLAEYISGLKITHICAELTTFVQGRPVDDDCNCLLKFDNGAKGVLHASQIAIGEENNLAIWVHGEKGSLEWHQEHPNYLYVRTDNEPEKVWKRGNGYVGAYSAAAARGTRIPSGHPEAFLEAFANNYMNFAETVKCAIAGEKPSELALDFPGVDQGVRGMLFIETVVASSKSDQKWTPMKQ